MISAEPKLLEITSAKYAGDFKLRLTFNQEEERVVDFSDFLLHTKSPMTTKYRDKDLFKNFTLKYGDLCWGDYEMVFPVADLYTGRL
ncbi:MAG: DUF2442 domain-containing protein [Kiritimatiellae bacterium]|nr:DUF2442 domain-containing protein [Kiritimatiellia bacterium]